MGQNDERHPKFPDRDTVALTGTGDREPAASTGLLPLRSALILLLAFVIAVIFGAGTYLSGHDAATAVLVALGAFASATLFGMKIIC
jgi:hypothetical protein